MVLPNLPPIRISIDDVRTQLDSERNEPDPDDRPLEDEDIVGWRRTWLDPDDHSKGRTCKPVTYAEYKAINAELGDLPSVLIGDPDAPQEEAATPRRVADDSAGG